MLMKTTPLWFLLVLTITSCGTFNNGFHYYGDARNNNPENVAVLAYDSDITIRAINGERVNFNRTGGSKVIYLQAGEYIFTVSYRRHFSGAKQTLYTNNLDFGPHILEGGKHYKLFASLPLGNSIFFIIRESPEPVDTR